MTIIELHNSAEARRWLLQGLWLQRTAAPVAADVRGILEWSLELAAGGGALPPLGFLADVGRMVFGEAASRWPHHLPGVPGFPAGVFRAYEDHVLGRLAGDRTFERAAGAVAHYQGRDRARGLAFLLNQMREHALFGGALLSPAVIKGLLSESPDALLAAGWDSLDQTAADPSFPQFYEELISTVRQAGRLLGPEDLFELEQRTALSGFGERLALRQVLQAQVKFELELPQLPPAAPAGSREVATRFFEEDAYPIGGFNSIATRGSLESLLHSQLAYMEPADRPDLFDIKFLRDELLYYARDENEFLRRRRKFLFALAGDLSQIRIKDPELPWQRIVLALALVSTAIHTLTTWLNRDALAFEVLFLENPTGTPLAAERKLLELLLREEVGLGLVRIGQIPAEGLSEHFELLSTGSHCQGLLIAAAEPSPIIGNPDLRYLHLNEPRPLLTPALDVANSSEGETPWESWHCVLRDLLRGWL